MLAELCAICIYDQAEAREVGPVFTFECSSERSERTFLQKLLKTGDAFGAAYI